MLCTDPPGTMIPPSIVLPQLSLPVFSLSLVLFRFLLCCFSRLAESGRTRTGLCVTSTYRTFPNYLARNDVNCHATLARFLAYTASVEGRAYQLSLHDRKNTDLHPLATHPVGFTFHRHHCIPNLPPGRTHHLADHSLSHKTHLETK